MFDGGAGGGNALVFDNGPHEAAAFSTGPVNDVVTLDGQALHYAEVQSVNIADPQSVSLAANQTGVLSWTGTQLELASSDGNQLFTPSNQDFDLVLGAGDVLTVNTINFDSIDNGAAFNISGDGSSIEFAGNITDSAGISAAVNASDTQSITNPTATTTESLTSPTVSSAITLDAGYTIQASTISLTANATTTETIANTAANLVTSAAIVTTNLAQITIDGTLDATGAVSVISTVTVNDSIDNTDATLMHAVSVTANDTSAVTFGVTSSVTAATLDAEANTNVTATIDADHIGTGVLPEFIPLSLLGVAVQVSANVTNTTTVTVAPGASIGVGAASISAALPAAAWLAANDDTNVTTAVTLDDPVDLPVVGNVLVFSALDSADTLSRVTSVDVGNLSATAAPAATMLALPGGDIALSATSGGSVSNTETSSGLGTVEIDAGGAAAI